MNINDPISDMLIRIKNALMSGHARVSLPKSKIKEAIAKILKTHHYIEGYQVVEKKPQDELVIELRYVDDSPAITGLKRLSKPSRRRYAPANKLPRTLRGYGITILSTNQGILTDKEARQNNVGGELLCQVW